MWESWEGTENSLHNHPKYRCTIYPLPMPPFILPLLFIFLPLSLHFRDPFFLIGADEDGDFITGLRWIIMWCNWPSGPIGGALLQLISLEEALLCPGGGPPHSWGLAVAPVIERLVKCNTLQLQKAVSSRCFGIAPYLLFLARIADVDWNLLLFHNHELINMW